MSVYIAQLNTVLKTPRSEGARAIIQKRFENWYAALPSVARARRFSMAEFETALSTQGKYISPVLLKLGWTRKRLWASRGGQYVRFWEPPLT